MICGCGKRWRLWQVLKVSGVSLYAHKAFHFPLFPSFLLYSHLHSFDSPSSHYHSFGSATTTLFIHRFPFSSSLQEYTVILLYRTEQSFKIGWPSLLILGLEKWVQRVTLMVWFGCQVDMRVELKFTVFCLLFSYFFQYMSFFLFTERYGGTLTYSTSTY